MNTVNKELTRSILKFIKSIKSFHYYSRIANVDDFVGWIQMVSSKQIYFFLESNSTKKILCFFTPYLVSYETTKIWVEMNRFYLYKFGTLMKS